MLNTIPRIRLVFYMSQNPKSIEASNMAELIYSLTRAVSIFIKTTVKDVTRC